MKLSEAIRLGAMLKPQGKGEWSALENSVRTCALGAAGDTVSIWFNGKSYSPLEQVFPVLILETVCPESCGIWRATVLEICWKLNDSYNWTREQIADWVATIEAQQEELAPPSIPIHEEEMETV